MAVGDLLSSDRFIKSVERAVASGAVARSAIEKGLALRAAVRAAVRSQVGHRDHPHLPPGSTNVNPGGHAARPRPDNAINQLAAALVNIAAYRFPVQLLPGSKLMFERKARLKRTIVGFRPMEAMAWSRRPACSR